MSIQGEIRGLVERHLASIPERLEAIGNALSAVVNDTSDNTAALAELVELIHSLNGSSGSIGFHDVSAAAAALEGYLNDLVALQRAPEATELTQALVLFNTLQGAAARTRPEDSALYHADFEALRPAAG